MYSLLNPLQALYISGFLSVLIWSWFYVNERTFGNPAVRPGACSENVPDCSRKKTERTVEKIRNSFAICICVPLHLYKYILQ